MDYVASGYNVIAWNALWFVGWVLAFYGCGTFLVRPIGGDEDVYAKGLTEVFRVSLGAFIFTLWVFVVGVSGLLQKTALLVFFVPFLCAALYQKIRNIRGEWRCIHEIFFKSSWFDKAIILSALFVSAVTYLASQAPAVGHDSLTYHLYLPRLFVEEGRIFYMADNARSLWPFMMEMLFTAALIVQGAALAKLFHWLMLILCILAVFYTAALYGPARSIRRTALFLMAFVPALWMQTLYAYNDNAVMLYAFLSFVALWVWSGSGYKTRDGIVAGLMLGALASVKMFSLAHILSLGLIFLLKHLKDKRMSVKAWAAWLLPWLCMGLSSAFWYIRSWVITGNPFFPFYAKFFGGHGIEHPAVGFAELPKNLVNFFLLPWNVTMKVDVFGGEPLGCLFLAGLPFLFYARHLKGIFLGAILFVFSSTTLWYLTIQHVRFLFPVLPFMSLSLAFLFEAWMRGKPYFKKSVIGILLLAALPGLLLSLYYPAKMLPAALGAQEASAYLEGKERTYGFMKRAKGHLKPGDKVLFVAESRLFYAPFASVDLTRNVDAACQREGISFLDWVRREEITHLLTTTRQRDLKDPRLQLYDVGGDRTIPGDFRKIFAATTKTEDGPWCYTLWALPDTR